MAAKLLHRVVCLATGLLLASLFGTVVAIPFMALLHPDWR